MHKNPYDAVLETTKDWEKRPLLYGLFYKGLPTTTRVHRDVPKDLYREDQPCRIAPAYAWWKKGAKYPILFTDPTLRSGFFEGPLPVAASRELWFVQNEPRIVIGALSHIWKNSQSEDASFAIPVHKSSTPIQEDLREDYGRHSFKNPELVGCALIGPSWLALWKNKKRKVIGWSFVNSVSDAASIEKAGKIPREDQLQLWPTNTILGAAAGHSPGEGIENYFDALRANLGNELSIELV